jgi:hypothetical protein
LTPASHAPLAIPSFPCKIFSIDPSDRSRFIRVENPPFFYRDFFLPKYSLIQL